jgi:hypothetical protein
MTKPKTIRGLRGVSLSDRRHRRTDDVLEALHLQMDACREDGEMMAMVVADEHGMCLASSGAAQTCSEIAARLPILSRKAGDWEGVLLGARGGMPVAMKRFQFEGNELYACAIGGNPDRHASELSRAEVGVARILST